MLLPLHFFLLSSLPKTLNTSNFSPLFQIPNTLIPQNPKFHIRSSISDPKTTLPQSAIERIADTLRCLDFTEPNNGNNNSISKTHVSKSQLDGKSAGEIFIPLPNHLAQYRVGHTLDPSWSTPENPVPTPGAGNAISRYHELREEVKRERLEKKREEKGQRVPSLAELSLSRKQWHLCGSRGGAREAYVALAFQREDFSLSGPLHLAFADWTNEHHRRSIAASLVKGVYILERDRQLNRKGPEALAPPWWEFFHFKLLRQLVDDVDSSIFGAIYEFKPPTSHCHRSIDESPRYVIAFRGTVTMPYSMLRDIELTLHIIRNGLHETSRFQIAIQTVRNMVATVGESNIWLAGHSLGAAMALLAGKTMAKTGIFVQAYLFNSPFFSAPTERIKDKRVKHGLRIATSVITAGFAMASKKNHQRRQSVDPFIALSAWIPCLFVNPADHLCSEYIGYFEHRETMNEIGIGAIEKLATQNSLGGLLMSALGKESEALHLIPSATLTVNLTTCRDFRDAHGIHQWWRPDLDLQSKLHKYN